MSRDIEATIRRHFEANDSLQTPIERTEIVEGSNTEVRSAPVPTRRRGYGVRVAVRAAVVTLILVGGVSLVNRLQESPVADSVAPSTLVTPSVVVPPTIAPSDVPPTTTPPTTAAPLNTQAFPVWTKVQGPEGSTSEGLITTDSNGFIYCDSNFVATSPNGIDWERTELARPIRQTQFCNAWDGIVVSQGSGGRSGGEGSGDPVVTTPSVVQISQPNGDISEFRADDGTVRSVAIGGTGILISVVDNRLDPALGLGLTPEEDESVIAISDDAGILTVHFADGTTRTVDLVEVGFSVHATNLYKTNWWFSDDGVVWTLQPDRSSDEFRSGYEFGRVLGAELGFYSLWGSSVWFTSHGVSWEEIGAVANGGLLKRSGGGAILFGDETLYVLTQDGLTEYALDDLPHAMSPVAGSENGVLALRNWGGEELEMGLFYAIPGQPYELEMEFPSDVLPYMDHYAVFGNRFLALQFEDYFGVPSFWVKDFPPN